MSKSVDIKQSAQFLLQGRALRQDILGTETATIGFAVRWIEIDNFLYVGKFLVERA